MSYIHPGVIEYRQLKRDGLCGLCGCDIEKDTEEATIVHTVMSKRPIVNFCRDCAYKIFYAPILVDKEGIL